MRALFLLSFYYGCAFYALKNPAFGILFFIHITIFRPEALVWGNIWFGRLHLITALMTLIGCCFRSQRSTIGPFQRNNIFVFLCFILWLLIVSVLAEYSGWRSFDQALEVVKIFVFCFLFAKLIHSKESIEAYVVVSVGSFGVLSFWGIWQGMVGNARLDSLWPGGSNYIAAQLVLVAPLALAKAWDEKMSNIARLFFYACAAFIILCTFFTGSRGAFLGLVVGMGFFLIKVKRRVRILAASAMLVLIVLPWIPATYRDRVSSIFVSEAERDQSAESRPVLWAIALRIWKDYPFAGVGLGNFSFVKEMYVDRVSDIVRTEEMYQLIFNRERYTHGLYPGMMAETGLIGMGLFLLLTLRNLFYRFPISSENPFNSQAKGAQAGIIGFTIAAMFGDFQYIEMLYLQIFFLGAICDFCAESSASTVVYAPSRLGTAPFAHTTHHSIT